ncbi:hypothetical protein E2C01_063411 [Portunus trituberculatus]|uniref:Uncharacterized protein n=1 Tax=Portunus trituberculatus TaxID=210409 RepID=A0A5B7HGZ3_PORTR|nr:hypothetical protein [Portunus trituberculatus]
MEIRNTVRHHFPQSYCSTDGRQRVGTTPPVSRLAALRHRLYMTYTRYRLDNALYASSAPFHGGDHNSSRPQLNSTARAVLSANY